MNELISFLTSKEIIVVYIVALVACALCFVIYLIDKNYYKRKQKHNTKELNKLVEEINEVMEEEYEVATPEIVEEPILSPIVETNNQQVISVSPIEENASNNEEVELLEPLDVSELILETMTDEVEEDKVEELTYTSIEPNVQQAQEELMRLTAELEKAEQESKNIDLTAYEEEQEENAIISLEELVRKSKEMYESNEINQYQDEGNEPISLEDLERRMNKIKEEATAIEIEEPVIIQTIEPTTTEITEVKETKLEPQTTQLVMDDFMTIDQTKNVTQASTPPVSTAYQTVKKFERSPVISPIYGIERKLPSAEDIELENTANYEKLDEEIKKTNEFLMTLRELQKNLD